MGKGFEYIEQFTVDGRVHGVIDEGVKKQLRYSGRVNGVAIAHSNDIIAVREELVAMADAYCIRVTEELRKRVTRMDIMRARIFSYQPQRPLPKSWAKELVP